MTERGRGPGQGKGASNGPPPLLGLEGVGPDASQPSRRRLRAAVAMVGVVTAVVALVLVARAPREGEAPPSPPQERVQAVGREAKVVLVQIGSLHSSADAEVEWKRLSRAHRDLLGGRVHSVVQVDPEAGETSFQLRAGPIASQAEAERLCAALETREVSCLVVSD